jgi:hypothetical protein
MKIAPLQRAVRRGSAIRTRSPTVYAGPETSPAAPAPTRLFRRRFLYARLAAVITGGSDRMARQDVVSIYFCGSGNHRDKDFKFTIPLFYKSTVGERKIIFDGPGGADIRNAEKILKTVESGRSTSSRSWQKIWESRQKKTFAGISGVGTASNIVIALQWLWEQWYAERFVDVNLVGFSRGGVSCIMLAHAIHEAGFANLGNIRVNIFAFDPVPGGTNDFSAKDGQFEQTGRVGTPDTLAPCVAAYSSILQENIKGRLKDIGFKCVVPTAESSATERTLYPMPGRHSSSARYDQHSGEGKIGAYLCQTFLQDHGTEIAQPFAGLSPHQLIECYAQVHDDWSEKSASRHRKRLVANDMRAHAFFVNWHHKALMTSSGYQDIVAFIDGNGARPPDNRLTQMARALPKTTLLLSSLHVFD